MRPSRSAGHYVQHTRDRRDKCYKAMMVDSCFEQIFLLIFLPASLGDFVVMVSFFMLPSLRMSHFPPAVPAASPEHILNRYTENIDFPYFTLS